MKRFVLLLLLAVLPLQISWAAGVAHCPHESDGGVHADAAGDASRAHVHDTDDGDGGVHADAAGDASRAHVHDTDDGDGGHAAGSGIDCSSFHLVALEPPAAPAQPLSSAGGTAPDVGYSGYKSHIPGGLDRPKWRFAA